MPHSGWTTNVQSPGITNSAGLQSCCCWLLLQTIGCNLTFGRLMIEYQLLAPS